MNTTDNLAETAESTTIHCFAFKNSALIAMTTSQKASTPKKMRVRRHSPAGHQFSYRISGQHPGSSGSAHSISVQSGPEDAENGHQSKGIRSRKLFIDSAIAGIPHLDGRLASWRRKTY